MATPQWDSLGDKYGSHPIIIDSELVNAEPYEHNEDVDDYHEKHVKESKGKLFFKDKNGKMRRTAAGEGLFLGQTKLNNKILRHQRTRLMKRTAPTKAYFFNDRKTRFLAAAKYKAYGVADAPSPQNVNAVRRKIYATATDPRNVIAPLNTPKTEIPANVALYAKINGTGEETTGMREPQGQVMVTLQDGVEPGTVGEHPEENSKERTVMFATHGVVNLACDPAVMEMFRVGDVVFVDETKNLVHANSDQRQHNIAPYFPIERDTLKKIGVYLGPCTNNIRGGICVRLDGEQ